jgi:hypothetical protein
MTKYPASNRRLEFLTHLAARSLYRTDSPTACSPEEQWTVWPPRAGSSSQRDGERGPSSASHDEQSPASRQEN